MGGILLRCGENVEMSYLDPSILYRYKYLTPDKGSLEVVTKGTIKYAASSGFNDPFDSEPAYDPKSIQSFPENCPDIMRRIRKEEKLTPSEYFRTKPRYIKNVRDVLESGEWARAMYSDVGVLCLSRTPCSMLMWSHYAVRHTGFVVEFKIDCELPYENIKNFAPLPVEYTTKRPVLKWGCKESNSVEAYYLTKCADWAYEEEERVLDTDRGPGFHPYERVQFLNAVVAGVRVSDEFYLDLQKAVDAASEELGRKISLYRAALSPDSYRVYIPGHPNPKLSAPSLDQDIDQSQHLAQQGAAQ